jgi:hypothetical protein
MPAMASTNPDVLGSNAEMICQRGHFREDHIETIRAYALDRFLGFDAEVERGRSVARRPRYRTQGGAVSNTSSAASGITPRFRSLTAFCRPTMRVFATNTV